MSQFEYVSVALALVYSLAISRLLTAMPEVLDAERRYWVHCGWTVVLVLAAISTWWTIWSLRDVEWTTLRFAWALSVPGLIHLRVGVLVSSRPAEVESWRDHYFASRIPFFAIGIAIAMNGILIRWVMGSTSWFVLDAGHISALILFSISLLGVVSRHPKVHGALVLANVAMVAAFFVIR